MTTETETELRRIEATVRKSDGDGLHARWESGRYMNTLKNGKKQLPKGLLAELVAKLGFRRGSQRQDEVRREIHRGRTC